MPSPSMTAVRRQGLCVLTLHRVVQRCAKDHDITWRSFHWLLDAIAGGAARLDARLDAADPLRRPSVALTFDDGTADHHEVAHELARRGMPALFFIPVAQLGERGHLRAAEVRELVALGHGVGSHAFRDLPLDERMPSEVVSRELRESKSRLEDAAGALVVYFAPPGGVERRSAKSELCAAGYTASRSMRWGIYGSLRDRWSIPCVPVTEFTLASGWVLNAVRTGEVPAAMRFGWGIKRLMPDPVRHSLRHLLHGSFRARR
jgi:peptidoglycan/xylan/chitin deacetylase (PgdA/CDA1 family)